MKSFNILGFTLTLMLTLPVFASGNIEAGKEKARICAGCHGVDGNSVVPMYPKIAGQHAQYFITAMTAYRDGQRTGRSATLMLPMVRNLSDQDIADLAAFYAQQTPR